MVFPIVCPVIDSFTVRSFSDDLSIFWLLVFFAFCAFYIFLLVALKVQNAQKRKDILMTQKTQWALAGKKVIVLSVIAWKIVAFIFTSISYCFLYFLQGSPQLWPLPIVLILSGGVFFMSDKRKYLSFLALCLFSIAIDLSGLKGDDGYGQTLVVSPLLIIFWGLYLVPGVIRLIANLIQSKKNPNKDKH